MFLTMKITLITSQSRKLVRAKKIIFEIMKAGAPH